MNVLFAGKTMDCKRLQVSQGSVKQGDFLIFGNVVLEVETIQRNCPHFENLSKVFTNWVLKDELGHKHYSRSIHGTVEIYRKRGA